MDIAFVVHDGTYTIDFATRTIGSDSPKASDSSTTPSENGSATSLPATHEQRADYITDDIVNKIKTYREVHVYKFVAAGLTPTIVQQCPELPSRLWLELDIVPIVVKPSSGKHNTGNPSDPNYMMLDEEADSVVRKALGYVDCWLNHA